MQSISQNEFGIIDFLVRNFSKKYTIRNIAKDLKASPAGIHKLLKRLEVDNILESEKLGTGLFYSINLDSQIARHLAAIVLLNKEHDKKAEERLLKHRHLARSIIISQKKVLAVSHSNEIESQMPEGYSIRIVSESEFVEALRKRDQSILEFMEKGAVIFGENFIVQSIKEGIYRI